MNRFEGLSLPELLDLLHGIVVPAPPSWLPRTTGWGVLAAWSATLVLIGVVRWLVHRRRNRYRRDALAELEAIVASDAAPSAAAIAALVKRTALAAYPRARVASLYGDDWAAFLRRSANDDPLVGAGVELMARAAYRVDVDGRELVDAARQWIRLHRA